MTADARPVSRSPAPAAWLVQLCCGYGGRHGDLARLASRFLALWGTVLGGGFAIGTAGQRGIVDYLYTMEERV